MKIKRIRKGLKVEAGVDGQPAFGVGRVLGVYGEREVMQMTPDVEKGDVMKNDVFVHRDNGLRSWIDAKALRPKGASKRFHTT